MINNNSFAGLLISIFLIGFVACKKEEESSNTAENSILAKTFGDHIDLDNPGNYSNQSVPAYITKDNTNGNVITDAGATLGRVLFYDQKLSSNNTISCGSCHSQEFAFSDTAQLSEGVNGATDRHAMRLVNTRFGNEEKFFWDERAETLEAQTTLPIQNHIEMGYSGENGDATIADLITKLEGEDYYDILFEKAFGDANITEERMQQALAQFIRSIQSFDSKYDEGRAIDPNDNAPFANFTNQENQGKQLFLAPPQFDNTGSRIGGGLGCAGCHAAPEFNINPISGNNGVIGVVGSTGRDLTVTRAPSLRDVLKSDGTANGPFMHIGISTNFMTVMTHYNEINLVGNTNLDPKLMPGGNPQRLNITQEERQAILAFVKTLAGEKLYTDKKWSDPFLEGN